MAEPNRTHRAVPAALGCLLLLGATAADPPVPVDGEVLRRRLSRTAQLFRDTALQFACHETISWSGPGIEPGSESFEYIFVYDEDKGFQDYRTPVFHGKRRSVPQPVSPEERGVQRYLNSAYLWIFTFRESRHHLHRYRILGTEEVLETEAVVIEFEPVPPYREGLNDWFGVAWVDPELGQLLKVVAQRPVDFKTKRKLEEFKKAGQVDAVRADFEVITTWFTEEVNGLRFPGLVEIDQSRYRWGSENLAKTDLQKLRWKVFHEWTSGDEKIRVKKTRLLKVRQKYDKYEFFSVRAEAEIRDFILRGKRLGG